MNPLDVLGVNEDGQTVVAMIYYPAELEASPVSTAIRVAAALGTPPGVRWHVTEAAS